MNNDDGENKANQGWNPWADPDPLAKLLKKQAEESNKELAGMPAYDGNGKIPGGKYRTNSTGGR